MSGPNRRKPSVIEEWTADTWYREFFNQCSLPDEDAESYAVIFAQNGMQWDMLHLLNKDLLKEMKINKVGHHIAIMRVAQKLSSEEQRSEITHTPKPTVQSKVVSLKSVVNLKDSRTRRPSEVGGAKRDAIGVKRSLPDEGPTLSVKMPNRLRPPSQASTPEESSISVRTGGREESMEVSSSTEKKQKKSVFERLGSANVPRQNSSSAQNSSSPASGILKKNPSSGSVKGPLKFPTGGTSSTEPRRCLSPSSLALQSSQGRARSPLKITMPRAQSPLRSSSPCPTVSKPTVVEPSFHVTVNSKLSNPLVTKVNNTTPVKRPQEGRSSVVNVPNRSNSSPSLNRNNSSVSNNDKQVYGSMAADHIEMSKGLATDKVMKMRLGNRPSSWSKFENMEEKKRVSFGYVRTKEIPAVPSTQPVNQSPSIGNLLLSERFYTGSIALGTARRLNKDVQRSNNLL